MIDALATRRLANSGTEDASAPESQAIFTGKQRLSSLPDLQRLVGVITASRKRHVARQEAFDPLASLTFKAVAHDLLLHLCRLRDIGIGDRLPGHFAEQRGSADVADGALVGVCKFGSAAAGALLS